MWRDMTPAASSAAAELPSGALPHNAAPDRRAAPDQRALPRGTDRRRAGARTPLPVRAAAGRPADAPDLEAEVRRLRLATHRRELTIDCLVQATAALRRGTAALREENRELRLQIQRLERRHRRDGKD